MDKKEYITERPLQGKKAAFLSLGCKVNAYETEAMRQMFEDAGAVTVDFTQKADIYIVNTCTVTNIADRKSRQMLHRAKKMNPDAIVIAAGCYVQTAAKEASQDSAVDMLVGNNQKKDIVRLALQCLNTGESGKITDIFREKEYEELKLETVTEKTRAFIKVQDGCSQFCTYCIIPYARGRIRSRQTKDVLKEVQKLAEQGYQEIVLTGIHLSSYGFEHYSEKERFELQIPGKAAPLLELVLELDKIPGISRIRLGSLEPRIITREFVQALSETKTCPHFHLSLQSGCNETLTRMNRRYNTEQYLESVRILREYYEHPAITTDIIVGFPSETEEEFRQTKEFLEQVKFAQMHIFKYSKRKGTKAASMPNQVPEEIKAVRSEELIRLGAAMRLEYERYFIGRKVQVLLEEPAWENGKRYMIGHNERYVKFALERKEELSNKFVTGIASGQYAANGLILALNGCSTDT